MTSPRRKVWRREWRLVNKESNVSYKELFPPDDTTVEQYQNLLQELEQLRQAQKEDNDDKISWLGRQARMTNRINVINGLIYKAEISLKKKGLLPADEFEKLEFELDRIAGDMKNGEILEYTGKFYKLTFYPLAESSTGKTVHVWGREWKEVKKD